VRTEIAGPKVPKHLSVWTHVDSSSQYWTVLHCGDSAVMNPTTSLVAMVAGEPRANPAEPIGLAGFLRCAPCTRRDAR